MSDECNLDICCTFASSFSQGTFSLIIMSSSSGEIFCCFTINKWLHFEWLFNGQEEGVRFLTYSSFLMGGTFSSSWAKFGLSSRISDSLSYCWTLQHIAHWTLKLSLVLFTSAETQYETHKQGPSVHQTLFISKVESKSGKTWAAENCTN